LSEQNPKKALFEQFALMAKAMGHVHRLELLEALAQGERGVEALANAAGISIANASQHLQQLRQAGLVTSRKNGTAVIYRLTGDDVVALFDALQSAAANHLTKVESLISRYYTARDGLEPLSRKELMIRMQEGSITLLDVRPPEEYHSGHVPGAINIPLSELNAHLKDLPEGREVVAYCRGTWCILSFETVATLRKRGLSARRLEGGFPEWKAAGLPVEGIAHQP
jgi:rhodanese-related sulfurtransferase/predicted transcriptional regulator